MKMTKSWQDQAKTEESNQCSKRSKVMLNSTFKQAWRALRHLNVTLITVTLWATPASTLAFYTTNLTTWIQSHRLITANNPKLDQELTFSTLELKSKREIKRLKTCMLTEPSWKGCLRKPRLQSIRSIWNTKKANNQRNKQMLKLRTPCRRIGTCFKLLILYRNREMGLNWATSKAFSVEWDAMMSATRSYRPRAWTAFGTRTLWLSMSKSKWPRIGRIPSKLTTIPYSSSKNRQRTTLRPAWRSMRNVSRE